MAKSFEYDVFITYASVDAEYAEQLHKLLTALRHKTFLDTESLIGGDPWPKRITEAQEDSLLTVILFSNRVELAYFQTGEILEAIDSARKDHRRRVIPVCLTPKRLTRIPSVLRPLQVLFWGDESSLLSVAQRIETALRVSKRQCEWIHQIVPETIVIVTGCDAIPELFDRPIAYELKTFIDDFGTSSRRTFLCSIVMGDIWFFDHSKIEGHPHVISIGGPGINALTAKIDPLAQLIRKGPNARWQIKQDRRRWALYGDRAEDTYDAVVSFKDHDLPGYLVAVW